MGGIKRRTDIPTEDVLDLLLLEATLDDKTAGSIDGAGGTHFGEHVLDDMLWLPVHTFADIGDVGEDRLLVSLAQDLRRRDGVPLAGRGEQGGVGCVQLAVEAMEELRQRLLVQVL